MGADRLKSYALNMGNSVISEAGNTGSDRLADTWRCTLDANPTRNGWDGKLGRPELAVNGNPQPSVAGRAFRLPRYAARGMGVDAGTSVFADSVVTLSRGEKPVVTTNRQKFIDQYLAARPLGMAPESYTTSCTLSLTRLRP